jgi:hypothetical protein
VCGILSHILREKPGMTVPESSLLGTIIAPKRGEVTRGGRKLLSEEHNLYSSYNIYQNDEINENEMGGTCFTE